MGEVASKVESELLHKTYVDMYLGHYPFDKDVKEKFGMSLHSLSSKHMLKWLQLNKVQVSTKE